MAQDYYVVFNSLTTPTDIQIITVSIIHFSYIRNKPITLCSICIPPHHNISQLNYNVNSETDTVGLASAYITVIQHRPITSSLAHIL